MLNTMCTVLKREVGTLFYLKIYSDKMGAIGGRAQSNKGMAGQHVGE